MRKYATAKLRGSYGVTGNQSHPDAVRLPDVVRARELRGHRRHRAGRAGQSGPALGVDARERHRPRPRLLQRARQRHHRLLQQGHDGSARAASRADHERLHDDLRERRQREERGRRAAADDRNFARAEKGGFDWTSDFNISHNANKVTALYQSQPFASGIGGVNYVAVGQPIGIFYTQKFTGVDPATGNSLFQNEGRHRHDVARRPATGSTSAARTRSTTGACGTRSCGRTST